MLNIVFRYFPKKIPHCKRYSYSGKLHQLIISSPKSYFLQRPLPQFAGALSATHPFTTHSARGGALWREQQALRSRPQREQQAPRSRRQRVQQALQSRRQREQQALRTRRQREQQALRSRRQREQQALRSRHQREQQALRTRRQRATDREPFMTWLTAAAAAHSAPSRILLLFRHQPS